MKEIKQEIKKPKLTEEKEKELLKDVRKIKKIIKIIDICEKKYELTQKVALIRNRLIRTIEIIEE